MNKDIFQRYLHLWEDNFSKEASPELAMEIYRKFKNVPDEDWVKIADMILDIEDFFPRIKTIRIYLTKVGYYHRLSEKKKLEQEQEEKEYRSKFSKEEVNKNRFNLKQMLEDLRKNNFGELADRIERRRKNERHI